MKNSVLAIALAVASVPFTFAAQNKPATPAPAVNPPAASGSATTGATTTTPKVKKQKNHKKPVKSTGTAATTPAPAAKPAGSGK